MFASLRLASLACLGLGIGLVASPRHALAGGSLPGGATIEFDGPWIHKDNDEDLTRGDAESLEKYFNFAHCECSRSSNNDEFLEGDFAWQYVYKSGGQLVSRPADIWVGSQCESNDGSTRSQNCSQVDTIMDIESLNGATVRRPVPLFRLMAPKMSQTECPVTSGETSTYLLVDTQGDGTYDYDLPKVQKWDAQPPALPSKVTASPAEGGVKLSWTNSTERPLDTEYYQFVCATKEGLPARTKRSHSPKFQTTKMLCDDVDVPIAFTATDTTDNPTTPDWLNDVDDNDAFICGQTSGTSTSARIGGLQYGVEYQVAMIAVDHAGNAIGQFVPGTIVPTAVIDFWEDLHDKGSEVEGGFCIAGTTFGDDSGMSRELRAFRDQTLAETATGRWMIARYYQASAWLAPWRESSALRAAAFVVLTPLAVVALAWHYLTLPGLCALLVLGALAWRRRDRLVQLVRQRWVRTAVAASALLLIAAWSQVSSAQSSLDPYWDENNAGFGDDSYTVDWHAGIKLGPYVPAIDKQFGGSGEGPYEAMFGGYAIVPMLDVDYIVWQTSLGQIGFGGSVGFLNKKASAYAMDSSRDDPDRKRSAEHNRFRMVPMAATAVFRLTYLDDKYRVPIVPYVRGGLAYYLWWAEAPDGGVSSVCRPGGDDCDENKGRGGSMGIVGSLGLALRAENIDFEAASAMREGGIQHAGFYAELSAARVDDFGIGNKLSVGDITWFAGVDFEF